MLRSTGQHVAFLVPQSSSLVSVQALGPCTAPFTHMLHSNWAWGVMWRGEVRCGISCTGTLRFCSVSCVVVQGAVCSRMRRGDTAVGAESKNEGYCRALDVELWCEAGESLVPSDFERVDGLVRCAARDQASPTAQPKKTCLSSENRSTPAHASVRGSKLISYSAVYRARRKTPRRTTANRALARRRKEHQQHQMLCTYFYNNLHLADRPHDKTEEWLPNPTTWFDSCRRQACLWNGMLLRSPLWCGCRPPSSRP